MFMVYLVPVFGFANWRQAVGDTMGHISVNPLKYLCQGLEPDGCFAECNGRDIFPILFQDLLVLNGNLIEL